MDEDDNGQFRCERAKELAHTHRPNNLDKVYFSRISSGRFLSSLAEASMNTNAGKIMTAYSSQHTIKQGNYDNAHKAGTLRLRIGPENGFNPQSTIHLKV